MNNDLENPFSVTKATEFSDSEINEYWVNFNTEANKSFETLLNPSEYLPKYLIGGKGCGKTHILRYFSFPLQKIRHNNQLQEILAKDKYIGLYSVLHGLNSSRFGGKGIAEAEWQSVFAYYFELYICDNLLHTIKEIFTLQKFNTEIEKHFVSNILAIFSNYKHIKEVNSISSLISFLAELRRKIDSQVLNAAFIRKLEFDEVKVLFSPGDLLFGIPNCVSICIGIFKNVKFIYIFDEYEKLFEWQKELVNTLVWDKKMPVTFWVGARRYGYTTRKTMTGQEMKSGSEFQEVNLDEIIRRNEDIYKQFAEKLYLNRLVKYYKSKGTSSNAKEINSIFCSKFESYNETKIIEEIRQKNKKNEYKHFLDLKSKLAEGISKGLSLDLKNISEIKSIIESIKENTDENPLLQKYKLFYFYKLWSNRGKQTFKSILTKINEDFLEFKKGGKTYFSEIIDKRKKDLIAQLTKENKIKNTEYAGIKKFMELSEGNPRSFILILKKAVEYALIRGERPLEENGKFSLDSQYLAVYDTSRWFYEDAELVGENGKQVYNSLKNLTNYLMLHRFCDKPTETTISCFYIKSEELSLDSNECINQMKLHSFIIETENGRKERNTGINEEKYQINKTLCPLWNLPVAERGTLYLKADVAESIFNFNKNKNFDIIYKRRKSQLDAPEFSKENNLLF